MWRVARASNCRRSKATDGDVPAGRRGEGRDRFREFRCDCTMLQVGRHPGDSRAAGVLRLPIVGVIGLLRSDRERSSSTAALYMRHWTTSGQHLPRLPDAGRRRRRQVRQRDPGRFGNRSACSCLTNEEVRDYVTAPDRPVVRHDLHPDSGGGAGGDSGHRQHPDGFDHRPAARTRRAAGGGRTARRRSAARCGWRRPPSGSSASSSGWGWARCNCTTRWKSSGAISSGMTLAYEYPYRSGAAAVAGDPGSGHTLAAVVPAESAVRVRWWRHWNMSRR